MALIGSLQHFRISRLVVALRYDNVKVYRLSRHFQVVAFIGGRDLSSALKATLLRPKRAAHGHFRTPWRAMAVSNYCMALIHARSC